MEVRGDSYSEVIEPVGRGANGDTLGADTEWENFRNNDPSTGLW